MLTELHCERSCVGKGAALPKALIRERFCNVTRTLKKTNRPATSRQTTNGRTTSRQNDAPQGKTACAARCLVYDERTERWTTDVRRQTDRNDAERNRPLHDPYDPRARARARARAIVVTSPATLQHRRRSATGDGATPATARHGQGRTTGDGAALPTFCSCEVLSPHTALETLSPLRRRCIVDGAALATELN